MEWGASAAPYQRCPTERRVLRPQLRRIPRARCGTPDALCGPGFGTKEARVDENEHPKGALLFMLIYLVTLSALWLNAYLRLWRS